MFELRQAGERSFYIDAPVKIGLVRLSDTEVCLIDSGNDKDAGRKVRQILDSRGWKLRAIYNTHSNADHIGGNKYLQGQTGCKIYAAGIDSDFTNHPVLEPSFLYGGYPPKDLRSKFLMAQESSAEYLTEVVLPDCISIIKLPGHFFDMVGFETSDRVIYLADCLSSVETLNKYQIGFIYDVAAYLETLNMVKGLKAALFIPAHAEATEDIGPLAQLNIDKVFEIADRIYGICSEPVIFESVLQRLFIDYDLKMNFEQYVLVGSTVRSYLSWMKDSGRLSVIFQNGQLLWRAI
jgi:glyoxylase-like metal-dependent hydrolase (beta-lactamase superfamily II)